MALFDMIRGNAPGMIGGANGRTGFQPPQGSLAGMLTNQQNPWGMNWNPGQPGGMNPWQQSQMNPMDREGNNLTPGARQNDPNAQPLQQGFNAGMGFGGRGGMSGLPGGMTGGLPSFGIPQQPFMRR